MEIDGNKLDAANFGLKANNRHSNWLIDSRQEFSLIEKKIIYCVINQLQVSLQPQEDLFGDKYFKIPVSEFGEDYSFWKLREAINKLTTRSVTGSDENKKYAVSMSPIPWAELKDGVLQVKLQKEAVPYFIDLKLKGYTAYQFKVAMSLGSTYSQRLFELLSRWKDKGVWYVTIEQFKFLMGIDKEKSYNGPYANGKIKQAILTPAQEELAEKTDMEFDYEFKKEGRKFVAITFRILTKKLIKHIESQASQEDAYEVLEELAEATAGQQMAFLHTAMVDYDFNAEQQKRIFDNTKYQVKFIEVHTQIKVGAIEVQTTTTRLMAWHLRKLGWK